MKTKSTAFFFAALLILLLSISIGSCKKRAAMKANPPADRILTVEFYPFWGGSSETILERKKGQSNLYSTYHQKVNGVDTILTARTFVEQATADSIYELADKVIWTTDANRGTAEARVGLKFNMSFKKGRFIKSLSWENLKNASELPPDIISVIQIVNRIAPSDFKIY